MAQDNLKCESPIEERLLNALLSVLGGSSRSLRVRTQVSIGPYRADMVLSDSAEQLLVVECDGHDFHDRTKGQAARDRRRDREILEMLDLITIRFTGREIHQAAEECAIYCVSLAEKLSYRRSVERVGDEAVISQGGSRA